MKIDIEEQADATVLQVAGNVDSNTTPELEAELGRVIDGGARRVVVDLAAVDFVSSLGLRALLLAARRLAPAGGSFSVCGPNEAVRETLDASGFCKLFPVFQTQQEALAGP